ncbi:TetR/AcrR family transcriptional regulator [Leekyejoonella antrihumi]|uniref:TetR family transcriptional regulator n=1 Tax=Leekyejoonella antrihumi TaxID=1660198 RepID=A0A563E228_9MICO|nr:TetR family transcriptional regulator [Leekyejoonella antrihumi]TWP36242.1 TetR family transcriptional regulator [Leekyejoonella antrihumi]
MARPEATSDDELLDAADRVLMTEGPSRFTLGKAAEAAGVSAATYIKRFGSKERLFLRLSQRWVVSLDGELTAAVRGIDSPMQRLRAVALHSYHDLDNPLTASKQLAALAIDLQNDEMCGWLHVGWGHVRRHLEGHAQAAVNAGQLVDRTAPAQLARIVSTAMEGGCLAWSVHPEGSLIERLSTDLDALLSGWSTQKEDGHG